MIQFKRRKIYKCGDGAIYVMRRNKCSLHVIVFEKRKTIELDSGEVIKIPNHTGYITNLTFYMNDDVEECAGPKLTAIRATDILEEFQMPLLYTTYNKRWGGYVDNYYVKIDGVSAISAISDDTRSWKKEFYQ